MLAELTQIAADLCDEAVKTHGSVEEMANIRKYSTRIAELLTLDECGITSHEYKQSNLLFALEMLLTKTPSQAKIRIE